MIHRNFNFLLMNQCKAHDLEVVRVWIWNARHNINSPFWSLTCHLTMHATLRVVDLLTIRTFFSQGFCSSVMTYTRTDKNDVDCNRSYHYTSRSETQLIYLKK